MRTVFKKVLALALALVMVLGINPLENLSGFSVEANAAYENTWTNTGDQAKDIVEVAKTQIGNNNASHKYRNDNLAWCASFVVWCARQAGIGESIIHTSGIASPFSDYLNVPTSNGNSNYFPSPGDLIFFDWDITGTHNSHDHVGIVETVNSSTGYITTIEGNSSNMVKRNTWHYRDSQICCYGTPNYENNSVQRDTYIKVWMSDKGKNYQHYEATGVSSGTIGNTYYAWYKIYDNNTGDLYNSYFNDTYNVKISVYNSNGTLIGNTNYNNSDNNWFGITFNTADTYSVYINWTGNKYSGNVSTTFTITGTGTIIGPSYSYTLSYNANGGTGAPSSETGGSEYAIPYEMPTRTGYTFDGWAKSSSASNGSYFPLDEITLSSNTTLYAVWKPATTIYTGTTTVSPEFRNQTICYKFTPSVSGTYKFTGVISTSSNSLTGLDNHLYLYNSSGTCLINTASSSTSEADFTYNLVAGNTYYFTTQRYSVVMVSDDYDVSIELVSTSSYTLSYNANGGSGAPSDQTGETSYTISSTVPTRFGYTFLGWSKNSSATSATYEPGENISLSSNTTLYAVWKSATSMSAHTSYPAVVNFENQEIYYSFTPSSSGDYVFKSVGSLDTRVYVYTSSGTEIGYDDDSSDEGNNFKLKINLTSGTKYYVKVRAYSSNTGSSVFSVVKDTPATYTLSYSANGGSGAPSSNTGATSYTVSSAVPTRFGYNFIGWSKSSSATSATYESGDTITLTADTTLYAVWSQPQISVNSSATANIQNGGQTYYFKLCPPSGSSYVIYSTGTSDTRAYLYDSNGNEVENNDDGGDGQNFRICRNLTGNAEYYLAVKYYNSSSTGSIPVKFGYAYGVYYYANGGSGDPDDQVKDYGKDLTLSTTIPTRNGYTFLGWSTSSSSTTATYSPGDVYSSNSTAYLYAVWEEAKYDLIYDGNGYSSYNSSVFGIVTSTIKTTLPDRKGYTFLGWSKDRNATSATYKPGDSITLTADTTLYAVWKSATAISVNSNITTTIDFAGQEVYYTFTPSSSGEYTFESSGSLDSKVFLYSSSGTEIGRDDDSSENGTNFKLTKSLTSGTKYYVMVSAYNGNTGTTTFVVAKETPATYTLTYNANGGSGAPSSQTGATSYTISSTVPTRFGYTFLGWSKSSSATYATYEPGDSISLSSDTMLYAVWKSAATISANTNISTSVSFANQEVYYTFTPSSSGDYTFESSGSLDSKIYLYSSSGTELGYDDDSSENGNNFMLTESLTANSKYYIKIRAYDSYTGSTSFTITQETSATYTLSYNANGGSGAPSSNTGATSYTISSTIPTRFGHTFLGWSKSSSATSATYESGDSISLSSDTTLYAVWRSVNSISLDYSLSVPITTAGQEQLVKFVPDSSKSYTIESSGSDDTYVYLYDEDGNRISYNDDGGDNQNFSLSYDLVAGETYYYGIKFYDSTKTGTISVSLNADNSSIAKGDVNSDGYVDATDASLIARYDAGYVTLTSNQLAVADVNEDGYVDATDASLIARYDAGYISEI